MNLDLDKKLREIGDVLKNIKLPANDCGILSGAAGLILFQFYFSKYSGDEQYAKLAVENIQKCLDKLGSEYRIGSFCSGIAGFGWLIDHLEEQGYTDINNDEILYDLDLYLHGCMINEFNNKHFDFLHGAMGYGFYFFKRYRNTKSTQLKKRYKEYIADMILALKELSVRDEKNGVKWDSSIMYKSAEREYNFNLAHGMSSIVNFLSRLNDYPDFHEQTNKLLADSTRYICNHMNPIRSQHSIFPKSINIKDGKSDNDLTRLGWCTGDLGIGLSLLVASKSLNDQNVYQNALKILEHTTKRTRPRNTMIWDAMLCHGSFGTFQVYDFIYKETGNILFKKTSDFWLRDGLEKAIHKNGYANFRALKGKDSRWVPDLTLLTGIAGIGLSILTSISGDCSWDECLLISKSNRIAKM